METFLWTFQVIAEHGRSLTVCNFIAGNHFSMWVGSTISQLQEQKKAFAIQCTEAKKKVSVDEISLRFDALLIYWAGELFRNNERAVSRSDTWSAITTR